MIGKAIAGEAKATFFYISDKQVGGYSSTAEYCVIMLCRTLLPVLLWYITEVHICYKPKSSIPYLVLIYWSYVQWHIVMIFKFLILGNY